jgi:type I protein arginine methyltransferase
MIFTHRNMLEDKVRCRIFKRAIFKVVKSGDIVADIGTGSGILAFFAVMAGAKKVYAIESGDIIEEAKIIAKSNNWPDRIEFIKNISINVNLPQKVDVVISETLGNFALEENIVKSMIDAKERFLKKDGIMLPESIDLEIVPIEAEKAYEKFIKFWDKKLYGIDFSSMNEKMINRLYSYNFSREQMLAIPQKIHTINFYNQKKDIISINKSVNFKVTKKGVIHGMAGWFNARLTDQITISTDKKSHWKTNFIPIQKSIEVNEGDNIIVKISAQERFGRIVWTWTIENEKGIRYFQTFLKSMIIKLEKEKISTDDIPVLTDNEKEVLNFIFGSFNGNNSIKKISKELQLKFPWIYPTLDQSQSKVIQVVKSKIL